MAQTTLPVLIGRDEQLDRLEDALLAANRQESRFVVLAGEAGIGKTRLCNELIVRAHKLGCAVLSGGCSEADLALPYLPLLEALGNYLSTEDVGALAAEVGSARQELAQLFPQFGAPSVATTSDPVQTKLRLFEAMITLLSIPARRTGVLLVIEDIHWADASTRELLDYLARRLKTFRIMVLVTYRSDELHRRHPLLPTVQGWRRAGLIDLIELDELTPNNVHEAIGTIFDSEHLSGEFSRLMHERTEGNPFVLEEMLKEVMDLGDIFPTNAGWQRRELEDLRIPDTVSDTILLRVQRLDQADVAVLQVASVLGRSFDYSALVAVTDVDEFVVHNALESATREQLLEEDRNAPGRYRFRHALTQEAIYAEMVLPRRRQIHSRAADYLAAQSGSWPVDIAMHLLAAGRYEEAVPMCIEGGRQAEAAHAYEEAARLFERALEHVSGSDPRGELLCMVAHALWQDNQPAKAESYLEEGIPLLAAAGDYRLMAHYLLTRGRCRWERSAPELAFEDYEEAKRLLEKEQSGDLAVAYLRLAGLYTFNLETQKAIVVAEKAVEIAEQVGARDVYAWALGFLGLAQLDSEDLDPGLRNLDRAYHDALEGGYAWIATNTAWNDVWTRVHVMLPELEERLERLKPDVAGNYFSTSYMLAAGYVYKVLGYPTRVLENARSAQQMFEDLNAEKLLWRALLQGAEALLELDRVEEAGQILPDITARAEIQDIIYDSTVQIRYRLAIGDKDKVIEAAQSILKYADRMRSHRMTLGMGVEGFCYASMLDEARRLIDTGREFESDVGTAFLDLAEARVALVEGNAEEAKAFLESAAGGFVDSGYKLYEMRTRILLAEALAKMGEGAKAADELEKVVPEARSRNARLVEAEALEKGRELGLELPSGDEEVVGAEAAEEERIDVGERLVTVMFADVRGYTAMTASHAPQDMAERIGALQRWAKLEVERHNGLVDKFAGDAVMATFNVSGTRIDHAEEAMSAAIALRDKAALMDLQLGIGISVGPAIVGQFVADANVSVLGDTTNLAARLQTQANEGEIVLSAEAHKRLKHWLEIKELKASKDAVSLKGFDDPVEAYRVNRRTTKG